MTDNFIKINDRYATNKLCQYLAYLWFFVFIGALSACRSLPDVPHSSDSIELTKKVQALNAAQLDASKQAFAHLSGIDEQTDIHPSLSGYYPISTGANAFAARSILSDMASSTIDAQYYIWHDDEAGELMLKDLWEAAERGVLVRLLLDDMNSNPRLDELLLHFANHKNIAVRLVNPSVYRKFRTVGAISQPKRTNRRMHNKSMTFDNRISIIGGRNIGNEYLNNTQDNQFADLDVLLVGAVVPQITASFDDFWNSPFAYDIELVAKKQQQDLDDFTQALIKVDISAKKNASQDEQALRTYRAAVASSTIGQDLINKQIPFRWVAINAYSDPATKLNGSAQKTDLLIEKMRANFGKPNHSLSIISSYFVPTKQGVDTLVNLARDGVKIRILTNSYDATDVGSVHAGYAHWRKDLLSAGIEIYELKSTAKRQASTTDKSAKKDNRLWRTYGHTTTSLHAKAFAIDDYQVFIGSYNIDPRSANFNSEMGVIIEDELLTSHIHDAFGDNLLPQAYKLVLHEGKIQWHTIENGTPIVLNEEPNMRLSDRAIIHLMGLTPIDWLL